MNQVDGTDTKAETTQLTAEQEELRQIAANELDEQMRILGENCTELTELFEKIIALEEEIGIRILRGKLNQESVGYRGALKLRSNLFKRRSNLHAYSIEELSELTKQTIIIGDGITTIHAIFEKHFNLINEKREILAGKSLGEQLKSVKAQAEITKNFTKDVIVNGRVLSQFRLITGEGLLDKIDRNRSKILSTAALIAALALGGAAKSCDCNPADETSPAAKDNEMAYLDPDLTD